MKKETNNRENTVQGLKEVRETLMRLRLELKYDKYEAELRLEHYNSFLSQTHSINSKDVQRKIIEYRQRIISLEETIVTCKNKMEVLEKEIKAYDEAIDALGDEQEEENLNYILREINRSRSSDKKKKYFEELKKLHTEKIRVNDTFDAKIKILAESCENGKLNQEEAKYLINRAEARKKTNYKLIAKLEALLSNLS